MLIRGIKILQKISLTVGSNCGTVTPCGLLGIPKPYQLPSIGLWSQFKETKGKENDSIQ